MQSATQLINTVTSMLNAEAGKSQTNETEDQQNARTEKRMQVHIILFWIVLFY